MDFLGQYNVWLKFGNSPIRNTCAEKNVEASNRKFTAVAVGLVVMSVWVGMPTVCSGYAISVIALCLNVPECYKILMVGYSTVPFQRE